LNFVIVAGCVLFEVWTEFLNVIYTNFSFKGLIKFVAMVWLAGVQFLAGV
jgi:hypothetical protein